jgi:hypothetical protein
MNNNCKLLMFRQIISIHFFSKFHYNSGKEIFKHLVTDPTILQELPEDTSTEAKGLGSYNI